MRTTACSVRHILWNLISRRHTHLYRFVRRNHFESDLRSLGDNVWMEVINPINSECRQWQWVKSRVYTWVITPMIMRISTTHPHLYRFVLMKNRLGSMETWSKLCSLIIWFSVFVIFATFSRWEVFNKSIGVCSSNQQLRWHQKPMKWILNYMLIMG